VNSGDASTCEEDEMKASMWTASPGVILLLAALACGCSDDDNGADAGVAGDGPGGGDGGQTCAAAAARQALDQVYATVAGVDKNLLSLDVYTPAREAGPGEGAPVVVWVHGGGWAVGDKKNKIADKVALFNGAGHVLVSVNYRLSANPATSDPKRVMYPVHPGDVARALDWVLDNIASHGGDPKRLAVLGHSAGAHLAALVSTDGSFLAAHGHKLTAVTCTGSFDTEGYDIPTNLKTAGAKTRATYENAFGKDPKVWKQASPQTHVASAKGIGDFLLAARGSAGRREMAKAFAAAVTATGAKATIIDASSLDHAGVNEAIGKKGDTVMTPAIKTFLKGCFGG